MQHIYFSGIGGTGLSALAQLAQDAGYAVSGSDREPSQNTEHLVARNIPVAIGQDGSQLAETHRNHSVDWLVVSAAIPPEHPEIKFADEHNIKISKRDELINQIIAEKKLKLIAVSGTHGKTTTTGMLIWTLKELEVPISYAAGTNLSFGASGAYQKGSQYFIYEADEFDRNMLKFSPFLSIIPTLDYDHPDTYPTKEDYRAAFRQFIAGSHYSYGWQTLDEELDTNQLNVPVQVVRSDGHERAAGSTSHFRGLKLFADVEPVAPRLVGKHYRQNGLLVLEALVDLLGEERRGEITVALEEFPGTERRFERLAPNLYSDYAHHPVEIRATLALAAELAPEQKIVIVYQPHQNLRQHQIKDDYKDCFNDAERVYWLSTYLSREDENLAVLTPKELIARLDNPGLAEPAELDEALLAKLHEHLKQGDLVVAMGAGSIDPWLRKNLKKLN